MSTLGRFSYRPHTLTIDTRVEASDVLCTLTIVVRKDQTIELCGAIEPENIALDILDAGIRKLKSWHSRKRSPTGLVDAEGNPIPALEVRA